MTRYKNIKTGQRYDKQDINIMAGVLMVLILAFIVGLMIQSPLIGV